MMRFARTAPPNTETSRRRLANMACIFLLFTPLLAGQSQPSLTPEQRATAMEQRLNAVTSALNQTQQTLEHSLQEIQALRSQLDALRAQLPAASGPVATGESSSQPTADTIERIHEEQAATQAEIKLHEQTKIETASKYPLRLTGLLLFNAFSNAGVVDNVDLPGLALPRAAGGAHGSSGASFRQTLLGLEGTGPNIWGARSSAELSADFFGGIVYNEYGYNTAVGNIVRLRQGKVSLDWTNTTIDAGLTTPLISPLSPTSFATVAEPALSSAGNLWTWSPQLRLEQRIPLSERSAFHLEAGLLDPPAPPSAGTSIQGSSPVEASRHPGVEGRVAYSHGESPHPFELGFATYTSDQFYTGNPHVHSWAVTADWQLPMSRWFTISGEAYRGRALGGLGGGGYKDVLTGTSRQTGLPITSGVDTVGGWSQLKTRFSSTLEANAVFGLDDALASNFRRVSLPTSTSPYAFFARNSMVVGNVIYRPKTYLIFSPEYRRIISWPNAGAGYVSNIFTLSAGYQF